MPAVAPSLTPIPGSGRRELGPSRDPRLASIRAKVAGGERLSLAEGEVLYGTPDIWGVIELADSVRRQMHGDVAYYNINRHLNYSNICALSCKFCEFARTKDEPGAYTRDLAYIADQARAAEAAGATEMHMVGGLHPYLPWDYYPSIIRTVREAAPTLHVKAFTAVEIVHLAKIAKVYKQADRQSGIRWVLSELKAAGLGSLPGGGAEVFDDRVHDEAFKGKIRSDVWLDVHRIAHELGLNTNATILYGHIDNRGERLVHMDMLRRAQDAALARLGYAGRAAEQQSSGTAEGRISEAANARISEGESAPVITLTGDGAVLPTPAMAERAGGGYFQTIIPLPFFPDGSELEHLPGPTGLENLRTLAVARLMLDNFPHVKAFWIMQTLKMAQLMLQAGADDIDGTVVWYDITKVGGASTHQETTVWDLCKAIREAGLVPVERDTLYRRVVREGSGWRAQE